MTQSTKHIDRTKTKPVRKRSKTTIHRTKQHKQKFGTSKLEEKFAKEFLDRLGIKYVYQFEAKDIGRFYDFRIYSEIVNPDGSKCRIYGAIIEVQGGYWHADPRVYESNELNRTQRHDVFVDMLKEKWCKKNGIRLIYVWEKDINENPSAVIQMLKEELKYFCEKKTLLEDKKMRH